MYIYIRKLFRLEDIVIKGFLLYCSIYFYFLEWIFFWCMRNFGILGFVKLVLGRMLFLLFGKV